MTDDAIRTVALGEEFVIDATGERVALAGTGMVLALLDVRQSYGGHRFEELGDDFEAQLRVCIGDDCRRADLTWWEREDPPGEVLWHRGYAFAVLGSATGHFRRDRRLRLRVTRRAAS